MVSTPFRCRMRWSRIGGYGRRTGITRLLDGQDYFDPDLRLIDKGLEIPITPPLAELKVSAPTAPTESVVAVHLRGVGVGFVRAEPIHADEGSTVSHVIGFTLEFERIEAEGVLLRVLGKALAVLCDHAQGMAIRADLEDFAVGLGTLDEEIRVGG